MGLVRWDLKSDGSTERRPDMINLTLKEIQLTMNFFLRPLILLPAIILGIALYANAQTDAQTDSTKKSDNGVISGQVTIKGKKASGVTIILLQDDATGEPQVVQRVITAQEGSYQFSNVAPGSYQVAPNAPSFVIFGDKRMMRFSSSPGAKALVVAERETIQNVDFVLTPGGVITGRLTTSEGQPLIEQNIMAVQIVGKDPGNRDYDTTSGFANTDDRGIYRIFGLSKGSYIVSAGMPEQGMSWRVQRGGARFRQTFHPTGNDSSKATIVEVTEGGEATNVDITVTPEPTDKGFVVSGRVVSGATGQPVPNVTVGLRINGPNRTSSMTSFYWRSNQKGEFQIQNVTPGSYLVFIDQQRDGEFRGEPIPVEVIDQDVTGVLVKAVNGASISGSITFEGDDGKNKSRGLVLQSFVERLSRDGGEGRSVTVNGDGSFRVSGLGPGIVHFLVSPGGDLKAGFRIMRVERNGVVQTRGIEIKDGESITGVRLVVRSGRGSIRGTVKVENGELASLPQVAVWLTVPDQDETNPYGAFMQPTQVDLRGHFLIENLPVGNYEVNVGALGPNGRVSTKQPVSVTDGAGTEVTLTLNLKPN